MAVALAFYGELAMEQDRKHNPLLEVLRGQTPPSAGAAVREPAPAVAESTPELLAELKRESEKLEQASSAEIIRWATDRFGAKLTMATAFGPEGCVILYLLSLISPRTHVFNLDTGYQFQETLDLRDEIARRYGIQVELKQAAESVEEYERRHGGPLYQTNPDQCCFDRKVKVLRQAVVGFEAWIDRDSSRSEPGSGEGTDRRMGQEIRAGENQPFGELNQAGCVEDDHRAQHPLQPPARPRLHQHRVPAVHAGGVVW